MTWWANPKYKEYDAIICDGAVRSGKTLSMGMGFFLWAMRRFIIPCHLLVEFYFRYLTWLECEAQKFTWQSVEDAHHTWESFEKAVPKEE